MKTVTYCVTYIHLLHSKQCRYWEQEKIIILLLSWRTITNLKSQKHDNGVMLDLIAATLCNFVQNSPPVTAILGLVVLASPRTSAVHTIQAPWSHVMSWGGATAKLLSFCQIFYQWHRRSSSAAVHTLQIRRNDPYITISEIHCVFSFRIYGD